MHALPTSATIPFLEAVCFERQSFHSSESSQGHVAFLMDGTNGLAAMQNQHRPSGFARAQDERFSELTGAFVLAVRATKCLLPTRAVHRGCENQHQ